ncbi:hypothetical protein [Mesorhizobium sp. IMUNJ 23232]|uniref:hypothetical protein n=1 Tax=Mesorhizobium sp. IMUNJ 23232 TaxID=3376064 RepID=UPI0037B59669
MRSYIEQRAMLARMEAAHAETERHLAIVERQIAARAERMTISTYAKTRTFGRSTSRRSRADERDYQESLAALRFERRGEIDALTRKLARQAGAIAAFRVHYRMNAPSEELAL